MAAPPRQHPLLALEQLASQCVELAELRPLCERACSRLTALAANIDASEHTDASLDARLDTLIARLTGFVERGTHSNTVRRLTDLHRLHELYELHLAIDAAFRTTNALHADVGREWQAHWQQETDVAEQQLQTAALDRKQLVQELGGSDERQREALALVKFAAENLSQVDDTDDIASDNGAVGETAYRVRRLQLLKLVFRLLLSVATVEVPAIPDWFISPNDIALLTPVITSDTSADVRIGEWLPLAKTVIVKQFVSTHPHNGETAVLREAALWYPLNHPHVLKFVGGCHVTTPPFLVYERLDAERSQTLDAYVSAVATGDESGASMGFVFSALYQVALALQYLHDHQRLVHNDVQCRNILVSADGTAKLCNFGCTIDSTTVTNDVSDSDNSDTFRALNVAGSLRWASPETLRHDRIGPAADVYALGMCVLEAATGGDLPWGFADDQLIRASVVAGRLPDRDARVTDETWALVTAMCSFDPETRPSLVTVVASLKALGERARVQSREDASRAVGRDASSLLTAHANPPDYADYRRSLVRSHQDSLSDSKSVSSDSSSTLLKTESHLLRATAVADTVSVVTLNQKWLGIKINSIGSKIVVSKFLRAASGAMGEIEASGTVQLGDVIYAVNNQTVRGMDRHKIGAFIQSTPRPLALSFKREHALLDDCFRFNGLRLEERWRDRGSVVPLPGALDRVFGSATGAFSFELWFSLADAADSFLGGILLGAQDAAVDDSSWAYVHKALVIIDPQGNLCCSLLNSDTPLLVSRELTPNIWYQLVVTFKADERQLAVYLDGELRQTATDCSLLRQWERLAFVNVGSGCISGISPAKPTPDFAGWYGFNGLVHDLKVWRSRLSDIEVHQLFRGASDCVDIPSYSLRRDFRKKGTAQSSSAQLPERVRASRPHHVVAQVY